MRDFHLVTNMVSSLLNMVWPAIYVSAKLSQFWWLVFLTIIIEALMLRFALHFKWWRAGLASLTGNLFSGFVGTVIMLYGMIFWHAIADPLFNIGTFAFFNWVMTYVLMCVGSVLLETWLIKWLFREKFWRLFWPMLTGNVFSYLIIVIVGLIRKT